MQKRHSDPIQYFNEQVYTTEKYILPFLEPYMQLNSKTKVFEIGCGEGGNLKPFVERGCECVGVDLSEHKILKGRNIFKENKNISLICMDIYKMDEYHHQFNLIVIKDVIEHIHDQERFMTFMKKFLAPGGKVFFAFPPWQNPFGGHQQMCRNKILSMLPYFHLFPIPLYRGLMKFMGESKQTISSLLEIKETGISLERFESIAHKGGYKEIEKIWYFINPNYEIKFGLKPSRILPVFSFVPYLRNYLITCGYYLIQE